MAAVNLMPWRINQRRQRWCRQWQLSGVALMLFFTVALTGFWQHRLNQQRSDMLALWPEAVQRAAALHTRVQTMQKRLEQQRRVLEREQAQQYAFERWLNFVQRLEAEMPENVWLRRLSRERHTLLLQGQGRSVADIHRLRKRLGEWTGLSVPTLGPLKRESSGDVSFTLRLQFDSVEP